MTMNVRAIGEPCRVHWGSDVDRIVMGREGTLIWIACEHLENGELRGVRVTFASAYGLRYLDELYLQRYWRAGTIGTHHVYEVLAGGWSDEESALQCYEKPRREWLIVTGNGCVSVFDDEEPIAEAITFGLQ